MRMDAVSTMNSIARKIITPGGALPIRATLSILLISALTGCSILRPIGPDYAAPEFPPPDEWQADLAKGLVEGEAPLQSWWQVFDDPALTALITRTGAGNRDLKIAAARIEEARAARGISRSAWFPSIDGNGAVAGTRLSEATTPTLPTGIDREETRYEVGLNAGWEIDVWGRVRRLVEASSAEYQASIEDYRDTLVLLYAEVALAYADVRTLQTRIQFAKDNLQRQQDTLSLTRIRFDAGLVPELDVYQAQLNISRTEAALPLLQTQLIRAINRLGVLIGDGPQAVQDLLATPASMLQPPDQILVGIPANIIRQRPDIRRAERQLAAQTARIGVARADLYPQFTLFGDFAFESLDSGDLFESDNLAYGFGPSFRWNLFSAGRVRSLIDAQEARAQQALHAYEQTVLRSMEEVENAMSGYAQESRRHESLVKAVEAAKKAVELVQALYRSGLTDFQNVLNMEQALTVQQDDLASSHGNQAGQLIRLYKALGGGWNADDITMAAPAEKEEIR